MYKKTKVSYSLKLPTKIKLFREQFDAPSKYIDSHSLWANIQTQNTSETLYNLRSLKLGPRFYQCKDYYLLDNSSYCFAIFMALNKNY